METTDEFAVPKVVDQVSMVFGDIKGMMPNYTSIPDEFKKGNGPFLRFQRDWFYDGLQDHMMPTAKEGIDLNLALRHLKTIQTSFAPKHEHKEAAVAYLASKWLVLSDHYTTGTK